MPLTSVCTTARAEPTTRLSTESAQIRGFQSTPSDWNVEKNTRRNAATPAAFDAPAMNPVTGVGEPWYTSGVQVWNGTAATLKPNPTPSNAIPASITLFPTTKFSESHVAMPARLVVPV